MPLFLKIYTGDIGIKKQNTFIMADSFEFGTTFV